MRCSLIDTLIRETSTGRDAETGKGEEREMRKKGGEAGDGGGERG